MFSYCSYGRPKFFETIADGALRVWICMALAVAAGSCAAAKSLKKMGMIAVTITRTKAELPTAYRIQLFSSVVIFINGASFLEMNAKVTGSKACTRELVLCLMDVSTAEWQSYNPLHIGRKFELPFRNNLF